MPFNMSPINSMQGEWLAENQRLGVFPRELTVNYPHCNTKVTPPGWETLAQQGTIPL